MCSQRTGRHITHILTLGSSTGWRFFLNADEWANKAEREHKEQQNIEKSKGEIGYEGGT